MRPAAECESKGFVSVRLFAVDALLHPNPDLLRRGERRVVGVAAGSRGRAQRGLASLGPLAGQVVPQLLDDALGSLEVAVDLGYGRGAGDEVLRDVGRVGETDLAVLRDGVFEAAPGGAQV